MQTDTRISGERFRLRITLSSSSTTDGRPYHISMIRFVSFPLLDETVPDTAFCQRAMFSFSFQFFFLCRVSAENFCINHFRCWWLRQSQEAWSGNLLHLCELLPRVVYDVANRDCVMPWCHKLKFHRYIVGLFVNEVRTCTNNR